MVKRRARKAARLARAQLRGGALIVVYHRISPRSENPGGDPFRLCVGPERFEEQIASLSQLGTPVALSVLAERLHRGESVKGLMAVTFDDGYVDNLEVAAPILRRYQIPATFFIVTGKMGQPFWWDRLTGLVFGMREVPSGGALRLAALDRSVAISELSHRSRAALLTDLYELLKDLQDELRQTCLEELAGQVTLEPPNLGRAMTWEELATLLEDDLFDAGGHSLTHPQLAVQSEQVQRTEMFECRDRLRAFTGRPVTSFAYPFGARQDISALTMKIAREAGYEVAVGTELDVVTPASDPWRLGRFWAPDCSGEQFSRRVRRWFRP